MPPGAIPIDDNEILYRRILPSYFQDPTKHPDSQAFRPKKHDPDGLSLYRAQFRSAQFAATNPQGVLQPVATLRAGDLTKLGMQLAVDPNDHSHVLISNLDYARRELADQEFWQNEMAQRLCKVFDATGDNPVQIWPTP